MTNNIFGSGFTIPELGLVKIKFRFRGRTTKVRVINIVKGCENIYKGWSRRSLEDRDNRTIGRREALAKALQAFDPKYRNIIWNAVFSQSSKMARLLT